VFFLPLLFAQSTADLPDLIVDQASLRQHWVARTENLPANFCSVQEGGITPGEHLLLRFTVSTPNVGTTDLAVGDPNAHIAANDGLFEFATCHNHYHFRHYALYELLDQNGQLWRAAKRGFCMLDTDPNPAYFGQPPDDYQRARFFLMRQVMHMFYAAVFLILGSVGKPLNPGVVAPSFRDFHRRIWAGEIDLADQATRIVYGRVHWEQLLRNLRQPRFEEALRIVSDTHAGQAGLGRLLPEAPVEVRGSGLALQELG